MTAWLATAIGTAAFLLGVVVGLVLHYITEYKPLLQKYHSMRLQGFVPQFNIEQRRQHDPSQDIRER